MLAGDRVYFSDCAGIDPTTGKVPANPSDQVSLALDQMEKVLKAARIGFSHVVFVNPYMTDKIGYDIMNHAYAPRFEFGNTPARATIKVAFIPRGAEIEFTGVAVRDLSRRRSVRPKNMEPSPTASPCVLAGDALFCSAKSGFIPGPNSGIYASSVDTQLRQTMRNLLDGLEEAGLKLSNVVSSHVYLDDIADFPLMNRTYAQYFTGQLPTRTTVQQYPAGPRQADEKGQWPTLEQISLIAEP
jgi:2-iminobutanoate/2-iminopropanoate deaminase